MLLEALKTIFNSLKRRIVIINMYKINDLCDLWCNLPETFNISNIHPDSLELFHQKKWYNREIIEDGGQFKSGNVVYRNGHHPLVQMGIQKCKKCKENQQ